MVARRTAKERAKARRRNEQLIRRSPVLSNGAKLLWLELSAWAWDDPTCFPKQELLILVRRLRHGNQYSLAEEIPKEVCDPARGLNTELVRILREQGHVAETPHQDAESGSEMLHERTSDVAETPHDPQGHVAETPHPNVAKTPHPIDEVHQREDVQAEEEVDELKMDESRNSTRPSKSNPEPSEASARCARDCEGNQANTSQHEKQKTYVPDTPQPEDPSELMEDPQTQVRRNRRGKNAPDPGLIARTLPGKGLGNAGKPSEGQKVVGASSPPPFKAKDVLALLRGESESKYGADVCADMPFNLNGKQRTQVENVLLNVFKPATVISMVRLLVWDWEVARSSIFPYKPHAKLPTIEALIQYQETLASSVSTGLRYDGTKRGNWNTYKSRYLSDTGPTEPDDPF
jgi:hypothetical protein